MFGRPNHTTSSCMIPKWHSGWIIELAEEEARQQCTSRRIVQPIFGYRAFNHPFVNTVARRPSTTEKGVAACFKRCW